MIFSENGLFRRLQGQKQHSFFQCCRSGAWAAWLEEATASAMLWQFVFVIKINPSVLHEIPVHVEQYRTNAITEASEPLDMLITDQL